MKITFILPTTTQPRFHKRVQSLSKDNKVKVFAFDRGLYKKNTLEYDDLTILGDMSNKNYFKRIPIYFKLIKTIFQNKNKSDLFYFFTIDFALLGFLFLRKKQYIYEIGDFAYLNMHQFALRILTYIDFRIIEKSYKTVLTSGGFKEYLKKKNSKKLSNLVVIPNKPVKEILHFGRKSVEIRDVNKIKFGFVGILRYPNTVYKIVKLIAKHYPSHEFYYYGDGGLTKNFIELSKKYRNLHYKGTFKNPEDLGNIYYDFDVHVGCYDLAGPNQKIAEPNKLYESIYFGNPIIATKKSYFGDKVEKLEIGYTIDDFSDDKLVEFIDSIKADDLNRYRRNMLSIDSEELIDSDATLIEAIINYNS